MVSSKLIWCTLLAIAGSCLTTPVFAVPPGGHYSGVYVGGSPGSGYGGDRGIYIGGYSGGYHQGYGGVYEGGFPESGYPEGGYLPEGIDPYSGRYTALPTPPNPNVAIMMVHVPQLAELWFEGRKLTQPAGWKRYLSPSLEPGAKYVYHVRARWVEKGHPVEVTRNVRLRAGQRLRIDLQNPKAQPAI